MCKSYPNYSLLGPQLIAHRGASAEAPENTLSAIRQAIELKVDWIEIDVHLSKDGVPVVIHDGIIPPRIMGKENILVNSLSLKDLKQLDSGLWFHERFKNESIPSLHEVLNELPKGPALMIEIKHENTPSQQISHAVIETINSFDSLPPLKIGSFSLEIIQEIQRQAPHLPVMGIVEDTNSINAFLNEKIHHLAIWHELLTKETISALLQQNVLIWTFTVDSSERAEFLLSEGIQGIITNNPRTLSPLFKNKKQLPKNY
jgi:glycerophosphoryl diester phosphodiesterase